MVNILGLTAGLTVTTLLIVYVRNELSYDRFFPYSDHIYRILSRIETPEGQELIIPHTLFQISDSLQKHYPEIEKIGRLFLNPEFLYENRQYSFGHIKFCYVEPSFFEVFTFPGISHDQLKEFKKPFTAVLTEDFAREVFQDEDPVGKELVIHNNKFSIVAVTDDLPSNSHMDFNLFLSMGSLEKEGILAQRKSLDFSTYLRLTEGINKKEILNKIRRQIDDWVYERYRGSGAHVSSMLQPVQDIHLYSSDIGYNFKTPGRIENILIFSTIAIFVLIIAISNFLNHMLADSANRSREVVIRKVLGADRRLLIIQFLTESVIISLVSLLLSIVLVELLLPYFGSLIDRQLTFLFRNNSAFFAGLVLLTLVISLIAGFYPAIILSRHSRMEDLHVPGTRIRPRRFKSLSVFLQLAISAFMITCLLIMYKQIVFLKRTDLGFNPENLAVFYKVNQRFAKPFHPVRKKLLSHDRIISVSASDAIPGNIVIIQNAWSSYSSEEKAFIIKENPVQEDFLETYGIELISGRDFNRVLDGDTGKFIINESAAKLLDLKDPLGEPINIWHHRDTVIGVVKDFHFESLYEPIGPIVFTRYIRNYQYITIRVKEKITQEVIDDIVKILGLYYEDPAFNYYLMERQIRSKYSIDEQNTKLMLLGTLLALLTSALGLFGLISFSVVQRTKEMGIRKVHGAHSRNIVLLMIGDFGKFVLPAVAIAIPFALIFIKNWMQNFAYRVNIPVWIYLVSIGVALCVALLAILVRVIHFAYSNPADSLRYE